MKRLTDRQIAVLAAVERFGSPNLPDLHFDFPQLAPSTVLRVLDALEGKGLIEPSGDRQWHTSELAGLARLASNRIRSFPGGAAGLVSPSIRRVDVRVTARSIEGRGSGGLG